MATQLGLPSAAGGTPLGEITKDFKTNGSAVQSEQTVDLKRTLSFNEVVENVSHQIGRLTGVPEKLESAKAFAEQQTSDDIQRTRRFTVHLGRLLLQDPRTRNLIWGKQAKEFKSMMQQAKDSRVDHEDATRGHSQKPQSMKDRKTMPDLLGMGAFGDVFKVGELHAALKILRPKGSNLDTAEVRFERESRALSAAARQKALENLSVQEERKKLPGMSEKEKRKTRPDRKQRESRAPFAPVLLNKGEVGGERYILEELLEGEDLEVILHREEKLELEKAAHVIAGVIEDMQRAHAAGFVHRDLKPANIKIQDAKKVKDVKTRILDWGLSRHIHTDEAMDDIDKTMTISGQPVGTPMYISPDQGLDGSKEPNVDWQSLALVFIKTVTGKNPRVIKSEHTSELINTLRNERENPSHLFHELQTGGADAVELARCLWKGDAETALTIARDIENGKRGPLMRRLRIKAGFAWDKVTSMSKKKIAAFLGVLGVGAGIPVGVLATGLLIGKQEPEKEQEEFDLVTFNVDNKGVPHMNLQYSVPVIAEEGKQVDQTIDQFQIPTGVVFYRGTGPEEKMFAIIGAYDGKALGEFGRRNMEKFPKAHVKQRRLISLFDGEPGKTGVGYSAMNDGHHFVHEEKKDRAYTSPKMNSDSLFLRNFKDAKDWGAHVGDPAFIRLMNALPNEPDRVDILDHSIFTEAPLKSFGKNTSAWKDFLKKEVERQKELLKEAGKTSRKK